MCGIAGVLSASGRDAVFAMTEALAHRGPDGTGYYQDEMIALGHRRLSIIDLVTGAQPIANETGELQLICNGEIYNSPELRRRLLANGHRFRTSTDVEVILHLYEEFGRDCIRHLRGMFAFALWDAKAKTLLLARDQLGQKPLFFWQDGQHFLFASEPKAILRSGLVNPQIDLEGLWHYVSMRYLPDQYSLFKGVKKLPAATSLFLKDGKAVLEQYWTLSFTNKTGQDEASILDELEALLRETVEMHLLSDVRVGAFLSGGIDSSLVSALMAKASPQPVPAFSIGVREQSFDELPYARRVAEHCGLERHEKVVEADLLGLVPAMVHHMDEPADPFGVGVYLVAREARQLVKVVLTGDGGDESFAGYDRFLGQRLLDYYCLLPQWFRAQVVRPLVALMPESFGYKSAAQKARWLNEMSFFAKDERYAQSLAALRFPSAAKEQLFTRSARQRVEDDNSLEKILKFFNAGRAEHVVDRMLYTDLMTRMPDHLLATVDRMAMAHSLETRSPLIDHKVVEYAAAIPGALKLKGNQLKYLLRKIAARYVPRDVVYRKKQGFAFPLGIWMRTTMRDAVVDLLSRSRFVESGIFERGYVDRLLAEHLGARVDHSYRLWLLINLEVWHRLNFEGRTIDQVQAEIAASYPGNRARPGVLHPGMQRADA
jgi:asparagine synthase (glutamine-hydrolysing)